MASYISYLNRQSAPLRIILFFLLLAVAWAPLAIPLSLAIADPNLRSIAVMGVLFVVFLGMVILWSHWCYQAPLNWQAYGIYGLGWSHRQGWELLQGLALGGSFTFGLFILQGLLGWATIQRGEIPLWRLVLEGSLTGLGVALAEEFFFRGWLLKELDRSYSAPTAQWSNGLIFAALHFLKPLGEIVRTLPQFPALAILGLLLVSTKRRHGDRLGHSIGIHGGMVWAYYIVNVGNLVNYTDRVTPWITGIDKNPLSGLMGIAGLLLLWRLVSESKVGYTNEKGPVKDRN